MHAPVRHLLVNALHRCRRREGWIHGRKQLAVAVAVAITVAVAIAIFVTLSVIRNDREAMASVWIARRLTRRTGLVARFDAPIHTASLARSRTISSGRSGLVAARMLGLESCPPTCGRLASHVEPPLDALLVWAGVGDGRVTGADRAGASSRVEATVFNPHLAAHAEMTTKPRPSLARAPPLARPLVRQRRWGGAAVRVGVRVSRARAKATGKLRVRGGRLTAGD